jgi:hypothetical protein
LWKTDLTNLEEIRFFIFKRKYFHHNFALVFVLSTLKYLQDTYSDDKKKQWSSGGPLTTTTTTTTVTEARPGKKMLKVIDMSPYTREKQITWNADEINQMMEPIYKYGCLYNRTIQTIKTALNAQLGIKFGLPGQKTYRGYVKISLDEREGIYAFGRLPLDIEFGAVARAIPMYGVIQPSEDIGAMIPGNQKYMSLFEDGNGVITVVQKNKNTDMTWEGHLE